MHDIIIALNAARSVKKFVEDGGLEEAMASINVKAAEEALQKANMAQDPKAQVWSAVNHLEGAEQAAKQVASNWRLQYFNEIGAEVACERHKYILALMAVCYRYLGEDRLCKAALDKADRAGYSAWDFDRPVRSRIRAITVGPYLYAKGMKVLVTPGRKVGDEIEPVDVTRLRMTLERG